MKYKIGIDASRNRSGGAKAHIIGILNALEGNLPKNVEEIHVWSYPQLLDSIPDYEFLKKHTHPSLEKGLFSQVLWQYYNLHKEAEREEIDIMLNTDAGTLCRFKPSVTMSRDMLSYEKGEMDRYGWSKQRLRLLALRYFQNISLKRASAAIFLTNYASEVIQKSCGRLENFKIIHHGVSDNFRTSHLKKSEFKIENVKCIYVSNVAPYKHQCEVAKAIHHLRTKKGFNISIEFIGGGEGKAQKMFEECIKSFNSPAKFIQQREFVKHSSLPELIINSDLFLFASSCENMPNTLIEGMCSGLPIACSNRGPMPEVLKDGGVYFNPEDYISIAEAVEKIITNDVVRSRISNISLSLSNNFSWKKCSNETFEFLVEMCNKRTSQKIFPLT